MRRGFRYNCGMKRFVNRLAVNRGLVRLSHALSGLWNLLTLHTPWAKRRGARNRAALGAYAGQGHIQGQELAPVAALPYGRYTMAYNGCEVIATYNALLTLGVPLPLGEVAAWYERRGLFLGGLWGTHVLAIPRFFREHGLRADTLFASTVRERGAYDTAFAGAGAAVFSFWNSSRRLRNGVHTVALSHCPGGMAIHNLQGRDPAPCTAFHSIQELLDHSGILPILLVTVRREGREGV